jgi:hypothetical protein
MFLGPKNEKSGLSSKRTQLAEMDKASIENARNSCPKNLLIKKGNFVDAAGGDTEPYGIITARV